ncbi:hypothetical protein AB4Y96_16335 [Phyllobacterium sp. TAF24]|uniref:hypothetical protein n=1 Tax=Phyllobacterium sp. TAF24 TaxID=3233068 RepID=UPI003F96F23E
MFATLRALGPDGQEVIFVGANDLAVPITHGAAEPLTLGEPVALDVEALAH